MKLFIIAVRDRAADVFGQPNFVLTIGGAIRGFSDEVRKGEGVMSKHPEDFDLYHLGTYDDSNATFELLERPRQIAIGIDCVE